MKRTSPLYYATGICVVFAVIFGVNFLFAAMQPTRDVTRQPESSVRSLPIENFEQGDVKVFKLGKVPVVVWRRNYAQRIEALEQLGTHVNENSDLLDEIISNGSIEIEPGGVLRLEWFVVSPINIGGYGCIVLQNAGDFGGFFDPCQGVHFDLWGQVKKGPTVANLQAIPWTLSDDGRTIYVNIAGAPKLE